MGAEWVHLGQEDLAGADLEAIKEARMRLGISTHSEQELETALAAEPYYVALGPVYETKLKVMKWAPQGLERVRQWKARIGDKPLVAIGGISPQRAPDVLAAGAVGGGDHRLMTRPSPSSTCGSGSRGRKRCGALQIGWDKRHRAKKRPAIVTFPACALTHASLKFYATVL